MYWDGFGVVGGWMGEGRGEGGSCDEMFGSLLRCNCGLNCPFGYMYDVVAFINCVFFLLFTV